MKRNKKVFSIFLAFILIISTICPVFADGIRITPEKATYRSGEDVVIEAVYGEDGYMQWSRIDENNKKYEMPYLKDKKYTNWTIFTGDMHLKLNLTGETVSQVVYAVYNDVSQYVEIKTEPDPEPLELVEVYPKNGATGINKDVEISLIFNKPVELMEDRAMYFDCKEKGRNWEFSDCYGLKFSDETPEKVILKLEDEDGNPIQLKENREYSITVLNDSIRAKDRISDTIRYTDLQAEYENEEIVIEFDTYITPKSITINDFQKTIYAGESVPLTIIAIDDEGKEIKEYKPVWSTSNPNVAIVDANGVLRARNAGKVTITASVDGKDDRKSSIEIEIKKVNEYSKRIKDAIDGAIEVGKDSSDDWMAIGITRAGREISSNYLEGVANYLKKNNGEFPKKPTEYERMTLSVLAAGGNPRNIGGYDLIEKIYNSELKTTNSLVFGLIALDAGEYEIPKDAKWNRDKLIKAILNNECSNDGSDYGKKSGWSYYGNVATIDMTGMAMTALAPYNNDEYPKVKDAIDRAVAFLSETQVETGGYYYKGVYNSESCDQAIMGLCTNGIDPTSEKFTKEGKNIIDALLSFEVSNHKGFAHAEKDGNLEKDGMATAQALYALDQYVYFLEDKGSIYHWGKDNIAPTIQIDNFPEEIVGEKRGLEFEVHVIDNRDGDVVPEVEFENQIVSRNETGKYEIQLKEGKNKIKINATDTSNNKVVKEYIVVVYSKVCELGKQIELRKDVPIKLKGQHGEIDIDLGDVELDTDASVQVTDETENEIYKPNEQTGLEVSGQIVNFDFKGISIDEKHPATLRLSVEEGTDVNKSSIYYFNEQTKRWKYIPCEYKDGDLTAQVTHFSVYGILTDKKAPVNPQIQMKLMNSNNVLLSMYAEDDSAIKEYQIFRDNFEGEPIGVSNKSTYLDKAIQPNTKYQYKIKAVDVFGNISDFGEVLDITTPDENVGDVGESEEETKDIYIRIEGYDHTILPRTKIQVPLIDLSDYLRKGTGQTATDGGNWGVDKFKAPTVAHAIIKTLEDRGISYDFQDYGWGLYISMIDGDREKHHIEGKSGWMYRLNDRLPSIGCQGKNINDEDELIWYYGAYGFDNVYTKMKVDKTSIGVGGEVKIHVDGYTDGYSNICSSLEGVTVLVNGEPFEIDEKVVKTDGEGNAILKFDRDGTYKISLIRYKKDQGKYIDIVRPIPISIKVGTGESSGGGVQVENPEYNEEIKIINDKNSKENDIVKAVGRVTDKLNKNMDAVNSEEDAKKSITHGRDVSKIMNEAIEKVKTQDGAKAVAKESVKVVNILAKSVEKLSKDSDKKEVSKVVAQDMKATLKAIDKIKDIKEISKVAGDMIDAAGKLLKKIGNENGKEVIESTVKFAEKAVEKASVKEINKDKLKVEKEKVIVAVNEMIIKEMAKDTVATVKAIKEKLKENSIKSKKVIENKVTIEIPKTDRKEVEAKLPANMMKTLKENGIEKAAIKTETAVFNLTPNTFAEKENNQEVSLSVKAVDRNTLTPLEKNKVPKGCVVVDLNVKAGDEKVSNFNEPITVSIPYKGAVKEDEIVEVFLLRDNGTIEAIEGEYDKITKMVTFTTPHFSKYFAKKVDEKEIKKMKVTFKDLKGYDWAKEAIEAMANKGMISGRGEGIFDPSANITRAEFATLVTKILGYDEVKTDIPFIDVDKNDWYYSAVAKAYKNGLISGRSETVFDPNGNITRQEMATIIAKVLEQKGYNKAELKELEIFKDDDNISSWARQSVSLCVKEKIISGMGDNTFEPKQNANRAQATTMLYKLYNLIIK